MPVFNSVGRFTPQFMAGDGRGAFLIDRVVVATAPLVNDTLEFLIPAGFEIAQVEIQCDDLDTNASPTFAFSAGYAPVGGGTVVAAPTYFAAAGQTTARTGGRLVCSFKPIKFNEDVILRLTVGTAAATFAAGEIWAIVGGNSRGVR
jgi:uncharacterized Zn-binding protein involved in type VI secretion